MGKVEDFVSHLSEKPWSQYKESDYTLEQYHDACLIHIHDGPPTSKNQCKLPIKTPTGAVNRNAVHSATAALAGARGGVDAPTDQKVSAAKTLIAMYRKMDEDPPPSLMSMMHSDIDEFLSHWGVKGMKWGIRRSLSERARARADRKKDADDFKVVQKLRKKKVSKLSSEELKLVTNRLNLEQNFDRLNPGRIERGKKKVDKFVALGVTAGTVYALAKSDHGKAAIAIGKKVLTKRK